ncbi:MAG: hypothetical protein K9N51_05065 [Candidatus Pacebacteria bacterium]|nr:hypothetical protein [Candidatus Paceibacterota bacterium]
MVKEIVGTCIISGILTGASGAAANADIDHVNLRIDRYPLSLTEWEWSEGWSHWRQYFPHHFKRGATIHAFVKNTGEEPLQITGISLNGAPMEALQTTPEKVGQVVWHRVNPETIAPGNIGTVYVRLRNIPRDPIALRLSTENDRQLSTTIDADTHEKIRLGHVGFNRIMDTAYVYVDNYSESIFTLRNIYVDGKDLTGTSRTIQKTTAPGRPALVVIPLGEPLEYGSFHCFKVTTEEGETAMYQVRVRDDRFPRGIVSGQTPLKEYQAKFFNLLYALHGHHGQWDPQSDAARLGFTLVRQAPTEDLIKTAATAPPGRIMYTNIDEPDAKDFGYRKLPAFERVGTSIMDRIEPVMRQQRRLDPKHETTFIVDRTFAPRNWLDYGEVADVMIQDTYVPSTWMGYDMETFPNTADTLLAAVSPRPVHMMFWSTTNTGQEPFRAPTPEENDMMVHYAIGAGLKGINYFMDWNSFPRKFEGGYYVGAPRIKPLWKQMGRVNAELERLSSLLAVGYPYHAVQSNSDMIWARSLLCGSDNILVVLVNRNHRIHANFALKKGGIPYVYPVDGTVRINLPDWFTGAQTYQVSWDGVRLLETSSDRNRELTVDNLLTSRVILFSRDPDIRKKLDLDPERFQQLIESEKPRFVTNKPPVSDSVRADAVVTADTGETGKLVLDLTDPDTLDQALSIRTEGELQLEPGQWLGLFPPVPGGGEAELVFKVTTPKPMLKVTAKLNSQTPNFPYIAHNIVGLSRDNERYVAESSRRVDWNGGVSHGEHLSITLEAEEGVPFNTVFVRLQMRDPGIVKSDEATNILKTLSLSWDFIQDN